MADLGARPADQALVSDGAAESVSTLTGFDPSRIIALQDGKYSPNLRAFLARQYKRRALRDQMVFRDSEGQRWIGFIDDETWFIGTRLWRTLTVGAKAEVGAWPGKAKELTPEPDFWPRYEAIGRCAIDEKHAHWFINGNDRFVYPHQDERMAGEGDERTCQWCGLQQRRVRWAETVERQRWEPALAMEAAKPTRHEVGSARKGDSAGRDSDNAQGTQR